MGGIGRINRTDSGVETVVQRTSEVGVFDK